MYESCRNIYALCRHVLFWLRNNRGVLYGWEVSHSHTTRQDMNEATVQSMVRLAAAKQGWKLWRNNVGVLLDLRGVPVRYGLANDSKIVNKAVKSGDLIGIRPVTITPDMVGSVIGQFVSVECKRDDWTYRPGYEHDVAQARWAEIVMLAGGHAIFSTGEL